MYVTYEHNPKRVYPYIFYINMEPMGFYGQRDRIELYTTDDNIPTSTVRKWVVDKIGNGRDRVCFWQNSSEGTHPLEVRFKDPEDAALFKLSWC